jgi:CelD/BcsL family acetyltransferase involved in cellulose biosynthesis
MNLGDAIVGYLGAAAILAERQVKKMREVELPAAKAELDAEIAGWNKLCREVDRRSEQEAALMAAWKKETDPAKKEILFQQLLKVNIKG